MRSLAQLRRDARAIFDLGVAAADASLALERHAVVEDQKLLIAGRVYDLTRYRRIFVIGAGKASARMAQALVGLLGTRITGGVINVKYGHAVRLGGIDVREAGHPLPDAAGYEGARAIAELAAAAGKEDLLFCLLSGGGSALLPYPTEAVSVEDKSQVTQLLLRAGATIEEINAVRKHLSNVKGGRLARLASPATVISLIVSDVVGDALETIASGPTAPDPTTFQDCLVVLKRYGLENETPAAVMALLRRGAGGSLPETPKPGDPVFANVHNVLIGSNRAAVAAAQRHAEAFGYRALLLSTFIAGETKVVAALHGAVAKEIHASGNPVSKPACVISGGETTVTVRGSGLGGRNQEFALAAAIELAGIPNAVLLSGGTDGSDGPTDAAGAIADSTTVARALSLGLDPQAFLDDNDSYHFFQKLGDLLITGPTLTNVMDLRVLLVA
jgi:hydroxypyruvate reductase